MTCIGVAEASVARRFLVTDGDCVTTELIPAQVTQTTLYGSSVKLFRGEGAEQSGLIVPVDAYPLDGSIRVCIVARECRGRLAHANDQLIRNGVELDAATVERDGGVLPEGAAVRVVNLSIRGGKVYEVRGPVDRKLVEGNDISGLQEVGGMWC